MAKSLRFGHVRLPAPQLQRQFLLLGNIHRSANEALEHPVLEIWNANATDILFGCNPLEYCQNGQGYLAAAEVLMFFPRLVCDVLRPTESLLQKCKTIS